MDCYYGSLKEKIPAHVIVPRKLKKEDTGTYEIPRKYPIISRKLKREDTGTYDNTAEA